MAPDFEGEKVISGLLKIQGELGFCRRLLEAQRDVFAQRGDEANKTLCVKMSGALLRALEQTEIILTRE